jgi:enoyl-CoA hydratase
MYTTISIEINEHIATLTLNQPERANAMNKAFWQEMPQAMQELDENPDCRVVIIKGAGKHFSAGIDLSMLGEIQQMMMSKEDAGRVREKLRKMILGLQDAFTAIEKCRKPVLAMIHGACIGGAIDLITACDMRYATEDAKFCVKEIDLAIVADVGTLQRLPTIISEGVARELAYTGKTISGKEAEAIHLVNRAFASPEEMQQYVQETATQIAKKSPLAMRGTKEIFNYSRDHSVADSLNFVATWNAAMLFSQDAVESAMANMQKREPNFQN